MDYNLLNPYNLLGVTSNSSLTTLKKNYYNLALLCHPDKGGNNKDMNVLSLAYQYIKKQLENINETTYEKLEEEFEIFCKNQKSEKPPPFGQIYEETNDWINEFNKEFDNKLAVDNINENPYTLDNNPLKNGYGNIMDKSDINEEYEPVENVETNKKFKQEIVEYEDPKYLPDTITCFPLNGEKIDDYSGNINKIRMNDYKKAFIPISLKKKFIEKDYPKEKIDYNSIYP